MEIDNEKIPDRVIDELKPIFKDFWLWWAAKRPKEYENLSRDRPQFENVPKEERAASARHK